MSFILDQHSKLRTLFQEGGRFERLWPLFDSPDKFAFTPADVTETGAHVRDANDLKRVMMTVIVAVMPCVLFGIWNAGHQYNLFTPGDTVCFFFGGHFDL